MKKHILLIGLALLLISCQIFGAQSVTKTISPTAPGDSRQTQATATLVTPPSVTAASPSSTAPLFPPVVPNRLHSPEVSFFIEGLQAVEWQPGTYQPSLDRLPINLDTLANPAVISGLTPGQRAALSVNGFTVLPTAEQQFEQIRFNVSSVQGQPYYLTTDAAYHALHITFDELLKALERDAFRPRIVTLIQDLLVQVQSYPAAGSPLAEDTRLAVDYLAVALKLFDPNASLPSEIQSRIQPQVDQVIGAAGRDRSMLIPNFEDDYGAYKPVGHYAGDPDLENYFRGMTWLGRVSFKFRDPQDPTFVPSRAPLIITLALAEAAGDPAPADSWKFINESLDFLIGPSDDAGPAELLALIHQVYGPAVDFSALSDDSSWQRFLDSVDSLPAPRINSTFVTSTTALDSSRDWRLMGQRFTFDASIFQNLIYDKVGTPENQRKFPTGLDVMAVFGSPAAIQALETAGETGYANYNNQMSLLRQAAQSQPPVEWRSRFYSAWLYTFFPQLAPKGDSYPPYMRTSKWAFKELNSGLGSWAELKHDTVLYTKMPEFMGGGGPPSSGPAPAYVEPNPEVFYRLAFLTSALHNGFNFRIDWSSYASYPDQRALGLDRMIPYLATLADQYRLLGDIAVKELAGQSLSEDDLYAITGCLGIVECTPSAYPDPQPVPVIAAVSGAENEVLEAGIGYIDRIYVVVPIDGRLEVAQGGIFSYYEFKQPRENRLTDQEWREKLDTGGTERPFWTGAFLLPGGTPVAATAFRLNDWYIITEAGGTPPLNVRASPSKSAAVIGKLPQYTYVHFIDGPVVADGLTWWKIEADFEGVQGWVAENPDWYERAYGQ